MAKHIINYRVVDSPKGKRWIALEKIDDSHSSINIYMSKSDMNREGYGGQSFYGQFASTDNPDRRMDDAEKYVRGSSSNNQSETKSEEKSTKKSKESKESKGAKGSKDSGFSMTSWDFNNWSFKSWILIPVKIVYCLLKFIFYVFFIIAKDGDGFGGWIALPFKVIWYVIKFVLNGVYLLVKFPFAVLKM